MGNGYHIYIHLDELTEESAMTGDKSGGGATAAKQDGGSADIQRAAKKLVSYSFVKSTASKVISSSISQVELSTGASEYQQRLQTGFSVGQQIFNAGESVVLGAIAGGPIGAIAGLVVSGIQTAITYAQKAQALRKEEALENISIGMQNVRAGTSGRREKNQ